MIWTRAVSLGQRLLRKSIEVDRKRSIVFDKKSRRRHQVLRMRCFSPRGHGQRLKAHSPRGHGQRLKAHPRLKGHPRLMKAVGLLMTVCHSTHTDTHRHTHRHTHTVCQSTHTERETGEHSTDHDGHMQGLQVRWAYAGVAGEILQRPMSPHTKSPAPKCSSPSPPRPPRPASTSLIAIFCFGYILPLLLIIIIIITPPPPPPPPPLCEKANTAYQGPETRARV